MSSETEKPEAALQALAGLVDELRSGNIADRTSESRILEHHLGKISEEWDREFPGFPHKRHPYSSLRGIQRRGIRDKYLKEILLRLLQDHKPGEDEGTIVNPICVFGRHARDIASRLNRFKVIATDIDPRFNWLYEHIPGVRNPDNYEFVQDNIFEPKLKVRPTAIVFFGACGSLSDAAIDYGIDLKSPYLFCRTCCHENIGGNTTISKRSGFTNWAFRLKNVEYTRRREKGRGDYFSQKYSREDYPTSKAAKDIGNPDRFMEAARNSVDSDVCRAIIDLDRYLRLWEAGYEVWYKGELFIARRNKRQG
jgi:hypothetical protein